MKLKSSLTACTNIQEEHLSITYSSFISFDGTLNCWGCRTVVSKLFWPPPSLFPHSHSQCPLPYSIKYSSEQRFAQPTKVDNNIGYFVIRLYTTRIKCIITLLLLHVSALLGHHQATNVCNYDIKYIPIPKISLMS
jgi:hypothetical protein